MYKAQSALINLDYGIFFKASDHEEASELGWLLYSTYYQDEESFQSIISFNCKTKYSALVTRQAALLDRLCFSSTWDLAANLELDKPDPVDNLWNLNHSLTLLIDLLLFKWNHTYISP